MLHICKNFGALFQILMAAFLHWANKYKKTTFLLTKKAQVLDLQK